MRTNTSQLSGIENPVAYQLPANRAQGAPPAGGQSVGKTRLGTTRARSPTLARCQSAGRGPGNPSPTTTAPLPWGLRTNSASNRISWVCAAFFSGEPWFCHLHASFRHGVGEYGAGRTQHMRCPNTQMDDGVNPYASPESDVKAERPVRTHRGSYLDHYQLPLLIGLLGIGFGVGLPLLLPVGMVSLGIWYLGNTLDRAYGGDERSPKEGGSPAANSQHHRGAASPD